MTERVLSVAQLNEYVRRSLAADPMLRGLRLRGEISNFKRHSAGHLYFTLKDDAARIACVMFRSSAAGMRLIPRDGMRVQLSGSVSLYAATGQYQFYVDSMKDDGVGELYLRFEALKARLQEEGLFDVSRKRPLPLLPRGVGVVTSPTGAVLHDIRQVAARRHGGVPIILMPSAVQGEGAAENIARALAALDRWDDIDVIILARGGGSLEELWAFNEEIVARAIFACETPVVSAIGHETDFTIADFVADVRAATPSNAAELVFPVREELKTALEALSARLWRAQAQRLQNARHRLNALAARASAQHPQKRLAAWRARADGAMALLDVRARGKLSAARFTLAIQGSKLDSLSPLRVLDRGYALVTGEDGAPLRDAKRAKPGDRLRIALSRGALRAEVKEVEDGGTKEKAEL